MINRKVKHDYFILCFTSWHFLVASNIVCNKGRIVDARNISLRELIAFWNKDIVSFIDKPFLIVVSKLLSKRFILLEEGLGFYNKNFKYPRSHRAKLYNRLKSGFCVVVFGRKIDFNREQAKTGLANIVLVRSKKAYLSSLGNTPVPEKLIQFSRYFSYATGKKVNLELFWGCDFEALNVVNEEKEAYHRLLDIFPNLQYVAHPKTTKINWGIALANINVDELFRSQISLQATFASGALVDDRIDSVTKLLIMPDRTENGRSIINTHDHTKIGEDIFRIECSHTKDHQSLRDTFQWV